LRDRFDLERLQLCQRFALKSRWGLEFLLHVMGREKDSPPPAISSIDQLRAVEIILQGGKNLAVSSLAGHHVQKGLRNLLELRKEA